MWKLVILTMSFLVFSPSAFAVDRYVCLLETKQVCKKTGCADIKLEKDDYRIIDTKSKTYTIGTDTFSLEGVRYSSVFKIFKVGPSSFLKMIEMDELMTG